MRRHINPLPSVWRGRAQACLVVGMGGGQEARASVSRDGPGSDLMCEGSGRAGRDTVPTPLGPEPRAEPWKIEARYGGMPGARPREDRGGRCRASAAENVPPRVWVCGLQAGVVAGSKWKEATPHTDFSLRFEASSACSCILRSPRPQSDDAGNTPALVPFRAEHLSA